MKFGTEIRFFYVRNLLEFEVCTNYGVRFRMSYISNIVFMIDGDTLSEIRLKHRMYNENILLKNVQCTFSRTIYQSK